MTPLNSKSSPVHKPFQRPATGRYLTLAVALLGLVGGWSCAGPSSDAETSAAPAASGAGAASPLEVTYLMGHLSTYTDKVGWSVAAENQPLSLFYLDKIDQVMDELKKVDRWEGIPLGGMAMATMSGSLQALRSGVEAGDWPTALETYRGMTLACNSCHAATRREYVVVIPVDDMPAAPGQSYAAP